MDNLIGERQVCEHNNGSVNKALVGELLTQVQSAGMLAQMVAGWWNVASPKVAAQGGSAEGHSTKARAARD